jgi:hypothetical protein
MVGFLCGSKMLAWEAHYCFYAKRAIFDARHSALNTRNTLVGYLKSVLG